MNKHTSTPWHVTDDGDVAAIVDGAESLLADTLTHQSINRFNHRENAAHIVRCVNSHEALVKALQTARKMIPFDYKLPGIIEIDAALAAAGAQP